MRTSSLAIWLVLGLAILAVVVSRLSRSLGPAWIIVTVVAVVVVVGVARELLINRGRPSGLGRWRPATKNVTPVEPALPEGLPRQGPAPAPGPSVIVVEPPDGTERLAAKLQALDRLLADGLVTDEEYEAKRARLIADF